MAATSATFDGPEGVAVDPSGNILVSETDPSGTYNAVDVVAENSTAAYGVSSGNWHVGDVYLVAGEGASAPTTNGIVATATALGAPGSIAVDHAGNVVIGDLDNNVRTRDEVDVLAESPTPSYGIASGNWHVGDLYVIAGGGAGATVAGGSVATSVSLYPFNVSVDPDGNVIVSDFNADAVDVIAERTLPDYGESPWVDGNLYQLFGGGGTYPAGFTPAFDTSLEPLAAFVDPAYGVIAVDGVSGDFDLYRGAASVPVAPSASAGDGTAALTWSPPSMLGDNRSPISYQVVEYANGSSTPLTTVSEGAATSATIAGLVDGTSYTFAIEVTNEVGTTAPSLQSSAVIPMAPPAPPTTTTVAPTTTSIAPTTTTIAPTPNTVTTTTVPTPTTTAPISFPSGPSTKSPKPAVTASSGTMTVKSGTASPTVSCKSATCSVTVEFTETVTMKEVVKGKTKTITETVVLGSGKGSLKKGTSKAVAVKLNSAGSAAIAHAAGHRLTATESVATSGGKTVTYKVTLLL